MGYKRRNQLVIGDLEKLLQYRAKKKNRSKKYIKEILSYYFSFYSYLADKSAAEERIRELIECRRLVDIVSLSDLVPKNVHVKNEIIIKNVGVTPTIAEKLGLQTIREDALKLRKLRYIHQSRRTLDQRLEKNRAKRIERYEDIVRLTELGYSKTRIAHELNISRQMLYKILVKQEEEDTSHDKHKRKKQNL